MHMMYVAESSGRLRSRRTSRYSWTAGRQIIRSTTSRCAGESLAYFTLYYHVSCDRLAYCCCPVVLCTECLLCGAMLELLLVVRQAAGRLCGKRESRVKCASRALPRNAPLLLLPPSLTTVTSPTSTPNNTPRTSGILFSIV